MMNVADQNEGRNMAKRSRGDKSTVLHATGIETRRHTEKQEEHRRTGQNGVRKQMETDREPTNHRSFIGQVPLVVAAFAAVHQVLHLPKRDTSHWREKLGRVDFLGAFFLVSAVLSLLVGLDNGSNDGWGEARTLAPLAASPALFAVFLLVEIRWASHPFAPGHIILAPSLVAGYLCNFFGVMGQLPVIFFLPLLYQAVGSVSAAHAGLLLLPSSVFAVGASLGSGFVIRRTGRYYWINAAGWGLMLLSTVPMVLFSGAWTTSQVGTSIALAILATGAGTGKAFPFIAFVFYPSNSWTLTHTHIYIYTSSPPPPSPSLPLPHSVCVYVLSCLPMMTNHNYRHHDLPRRAPLQRHQG